MGELLKATPRARGIIGKPGLGRGKKNVLTTRKGVYDEPTLSELGGTR